MASIGFRTSGVQALLMSRQPETYVTCGNIHANLQRARRADCAGLRAGSCALYSITDLLASCYTEAYPEEERLPTRGSPRYAAQL